MSATTPIWSGGSYAVAPATLWSDRGTAAPLRTPDALAWTARSGVGVAVRVSDRLTSALGRGAGVAAALDRLSTPVGRRSLQVRNGLDGEVLLPDEAAIAAALADEDAGAVRDAVSVYNEWIAGFAAADPSRYAGVGVIPPTGLADATAALQQCKSLGLRAVSLVQPPAGAGTAPGGDAAEFWEIAGQDVVVCLGATFGEQAPSSSAVAHAPAAPSVGAGRPPAMSGFLARLAFSGVADSVPGLRILLANAGAGWLPYVLESADTNYQRAAASRRVSLGDPDALPSEYIRRFTWTTFHEDRFAVLHRNVLGEAHLVWSSCAPGLDCDWPNDVEQAQRIVAGLPKDAAQRLLSGNCRSLFRVEDTPDFSAADVDGFERSSLFG